MRSDAATNRQELLRAGWDLLSEQGPDVPMRAIAQRAGVGVATLYRHFPTRDDLVLGLVEEVNTRVRALVAAHREGFAADPRARWHSFIHALAGLRMGALISQAAPLAGEVDEFWVRCDALRQDTLSQLASMIDLAAASGLVPTNLEAQQVFVAVAAMGRPLTPDADHGQVRFDLGWLVDVFLAGLEHTADAGGGAMLEDA